MSEDYFLLEREIFPDGNFLKFLDSILIISGHYKNGLKCGKWVYWHPNKQKSKEEYYFSGKPVGIHTSWDCYGRVIGIFKFDQNGNMLGVFSHKN
jgi:antitoxin component YwqK of YwqJK toxin-antitoxin module